MITQKKIAEHLGIAPKTVSNILSGNTGYRYSEETRQRVLEAAKKLGYRANRISRAVRKGRSNLIGVINFSSMAEVAQKAEALLPRIINGEGFDYISIDLNWHGGDIDRVIDELIQVRAEGIIVSHMTGAFDARYTAMLKKVGIPVVGVYGDDKLNIPVVADDARSAFYALARHLQAVGRRRILLLVNNYQSRPTRQRMEGFDAAMSSFGPCLRMSESELFANDRKSLPWPAESGGLMIQADFARSGFNPTLANYGLAKQLLKMDSLPDAIMCTNDLSAFGVFTAILEEGLRVPSKLAVTGCDNDLFGAFPLYGLTTVEKDLETACAQCVDLLVSRIRGKSVANETHLIPSRLVLRTSCGRNLPGRDAEEIISIPTLSTLASVQR